MNEAETQAAIVVKIKATEERLEFLRSLLTDPPKKVETMPDPSKVYDLVPKRGPGRPKKVA